MATRVSTRKTTPAKTRKSATKAPAKASKTAKAAAKPGKDSTLLPVVEGPIWTRRMGTVLIVNLGNRKETGCTWACSYCPWRGKTLEKRVHVEPEMVISEVAAKLAKSSKVESVILSGDSEPTVHPKFPEIVKALLALRKKLGTKWHLNCITNGSRLDEKSVLAACNELDETWVKLDCARDQLFRAANHAPKTDSVSKHVKRIGKLENANITTTFWRYPGKEDTQNWSADNLLGLLEVYQAIQPKKVHIQSMKPTHPSDRVQPVPHESLEAFGMRVEELGIPVEVF